MDYGKRRAWLAHLAHLPTGRKRGAGIRSGNATLLAGKTHGQPWMYPERTGRMSTGLTPHEQATENTVQDYLFAKHGTYHRRAAYVRAFKRELQRLGYAVDMSQYDEAGNCTRCGEAGRCPGCHVAVVQVPRVVGGAA